MLRQLYTLSTSIEAEEVIVICPCFFQPSRFTFIALMPEYLLESTCVASLLNLARYPRILHALRILKRAFASFRTAAAYSEQQVISDQKKTRA